MRLWRVKEDNKMTYRTETNIMPISIKQGLSDFPTDDA